MSAINTCQLINAVTEFHSQRAKSSQTPNWFSLISSKIKIITVFKFIKNNEEHNETLEHSRVQIQPRFITISKNSTLFSVILYRIIIIEQFASQFSANSSPRVTNSSTITKAWEEEKLKQNQTSSKKKKIKHRFIFGFEAYQKNQKLARIYLLESPSKFR